MGGQIELINSAVRVNALNQLNYELFTRFFYVYLTAESLIVLIVVNCNITGRAQVVLLLGLSGLDLVLLL